MKKRSIIVAAAAAIPAIATVLTGCSHIEQEPMPPGVFIQAPAPDTGTTPMPPADKDSFKPAPQEPVLLPPSPAPEPPKKAVKKTVKKGKARAGKKASVKRAPVRYRAKEEKYIVKKGDNLSVIAYRYRISVKFLQEYNKLKKTVIYPKQVLLIPATKDVPARQVKKAVAAGKKSAGTTGKARSKKIKGAKKEMPQGNVHIVRAGEDFTRIARLYRIKVSDIQKANPGVDSRRLRIGQKLNLTPGAKAVTAAAPVAPAASAATPVAPAAPPAPAPVSRDKFFEDVKDPEALPGNSAAAPAAGNTPAETPAAPAAAAPGDKTSAAPTSSDVLGAELNSISTPLTDEVVTMDGGKQAVTIRTRDTTIDALAKRFNSTPEKIREANGLLPADGTVKVGSKVIIP